MSQASPRGRRAFAGSVLLIICGLSAGVTAAQKGGFLGIGGDKNTSYKPFKDPAGRFELEYPTKDWRLLPSGGSSLAVFNHKDGPALFVDHVKLEDLPTPGEVAALPDVEIGRLKELQPKVKDFASDSLESKAGRGVLIRYSRAGTEPESVVQFSILVGRDLYRLNGVVPEKLMSKHGSIIIHMIQSFMARADPATSKG